MLTSSSCSRPSLDHVPSLFMSLSLAHPCGVRPRSRRSGRRLVLQNPAAAAAAAAAAARAGRGWRRWRGSWARWRGGWWRCRSRCRACPPPTAKNHFFTSLSLFPHFLTLFFHIFSTLFIHDCPTAGGRGERRGVMARRRGKAKGVMTGWLGRVEGCNGEAKGESEGCNGGLVGASEGV